MALSKTMHDATFGDLTRVVSDLWKRPLDLRAFGKLWTIELLVDIDPTDGVEKNQIKAFRLYNDDTKRIIGDAENAVVEYIGTLDADKRSRVKVPSNVGKMRIFELVKLTGLSFPYVCTKPTFGFLLECDWDEEHGLGIRFENGKVADVGSQDVVL